MSRDVRVGFIGSGFARRVQLPGLALVPGIRPTAIASGHRANAEAVAREFGLPHVFTDGTELARSPDVDLVIVSSTPDTHARYAIAALEAGKHVLCEKPMAIDVFEAAQMVTASEQHPDSQNCSVNGGVLQDDVMVDDSTEPRKEGPDRIGRGGEEVAVAERGRLQ